MVASHVVRDVKRQRDNDPDLAPMCGCEIDVTKQFLRSLAKQLKQQSA
jgi:hypothetical protein